MRRWRITLSLSVCLLLAPASVWAQDYNEVKAQATQAFQAGQFGEAAELFRQAFDIEPRGNLLYNIGLCYEKAGDTNNAIAFYQRFVEAVPGSPKRPNVQRRINELKQELQAQYEEVSVNTQPPGAIIFVDDKSRGAMGTAPVTFKLLPGDYTIIAELDGHELAKRRITLQKGAPGIVDLTLLPSGSVGSVSFLVSERDADVMVDGKRVGRSPLTEPIRMRGGPHEVMVVKPGFDPWKKTVDVAPGGTQQVKVSLRSEGSTDLGGGGGGGPTNIWPWVTMGVGLAAIGGGVFTGLSAADLHGQLEDKRDKNELIAQSDIDDGNSLVLYTNILLGVGTAAVIGGVAWWLLDDGVDTAGTVGVGVSPDGSAAFTFQGSF